MTFGGLRAVNDVSLSLRQGELVGLIGPNGAGKTTVFNMITGHYKPTRGRIWFAGQEITGLAPNRITALGIARTFQNIRLFKGMTVLENVLVAHHVRLQASLWSALFRLPAYTREEEAMRQQAMELLREVGLEGFADAEASSLPYGLQRRLEIARALATRPRLLLLDEPAAGMNPEETRDLTAFIGRIRERFGLTILLIEHDMKLVMGICERIHVLDHGVTIAEGSPEAIRTHPRVIEAYLGEDEEA
ncbi:MULTISPECIES: ABC transporter ATP-binding protein [Limnochorda]|uniref:ABC transporter ATP-binding protein n=1 Tax=Limnochorda TaxID=1676651 RepID=UPI00184027FC|nr:high-affinity branched-chain amino acid ABC transporter ATP-binding protein LivG [Bacillota bacterium]MBO2519618.1 high-affinity branched-chain amino acid ABC transporter ATP-binding protein LivG [Bacillota bacterium]NMA70599.1 ABC transporter ATP-binding protein [Bacillota bacterium]